MTKDELEVGETYRVKRHGKTFDVRLLAIEVQPPLIPGRKTITRYLCFSLATARRIRLKSKQNILFKVS